MKLLASWKGLAIAVCMFGVVGCGATEQGETEGEEIRKSEVELSHSEDTFVRLQPDLRACPPPECGGYFLWDVNSIGGPSTHVSVLDFKQSGLSKEEQLNVHAARPDELILKGRLGSPLVGARPSLVVKEAYRGLPGVKSSPFPSIYSVGSSGIVCVTTPCPTMSATLVNYPGQDLITDLDVTGATQANNVQRSWVEERIRSGRALVAGQIITGRPENGRPPPVILTAHQVYFRLPEVAGPCPLLEIMCGPGEVSTYVRSADRCLVPQACTQPGFCPAVMPVCAEGYKLVSWKAGV